MTQQPRVVTSPRVSDEIRKTTCYMCACRCGIDVHLKAGRVTYIEGNRDHPVNKGVLCAKGASGIMQVTAPSRLTGPLKRVGPRGSGAFEPVSWEEALSTAVAWMKPLRETAPEKLAFFTGRDQSQSLTGWWAQNFGTPNYAAHGGFCSVNMAAGGIYTIGGAFWEFGQPDWERTKLFVMFGVAEDHDSNPIKIGLGRLKERGVRVISVNPVRTGYSAVADDWFGITPGTDGLFILSLIHCLMEAGKVDLDYLARYTNAPMLVNERPGPEKGLLVKNAESQPFVIDRDTGQPAPWDGKGTKPDLGATWQGSRTVFAHMAEEYLKAEYAPEAVAARCGIEAARIRALAAELAHQAFDNAISLPRPWTDFRGEEHSEMPGRPVSFHAMRGISAHSNGFQTARALHLLQIVLGAVECPGGYRLKPPYPKPVEAHPTPHFQAAPGKPLTGPHLGYVRGPQDLALKADGSPARIDKAFTWEAPLSAHGLMHMLIPNAHAGDPYRIDTLFLYMANMSWNSSMNSARVMEMLTEKGEDGDYLIPRIIYSDAYASEMVAYADLILPDTTYLERHDCISLLDRPISEPDAAGDSIRWPVVEPDRDVRGFQSVLLDLGARLGLPGMVNEDGSPKFRDYADYIVSHQRRPGIGPLMGFRGTGEDQGRGAPNPGQIARYVENGAFYQAHIPQEAAFYKPWNAHYQDWAVDLGLYDSPQPYLFQIWSEPLRRFQLAAEGEGEHQPPDHLRARLRESMSPLPLWYPPHGERAGAEYPLHALTQRPMAMYHSWGSQNAWLRQIFGKNYLYLPTAVWQAQGFKPGDYAKVTSPSGEMTVPVAHMAALNAQTVWTWNAIGKRKGAWGLSKDAPESNQGFLLNHLISELQPGEGRVPNSDPVTGQAAWFDQKVRVERVERRDASAPDFAPLPEVPHMADRRSTGRSGFFAKLFGSKGGAA
ncbi:molybdopterin-dependent oxidoreductase [Pseudogemmobacter faecipullorum]|uniref:Molybdopterin-dependent oxidoreductase n=1 Tax=Pseudogemmobacter faecipullorum TaxID=2755041 RepID=A0ABS8CQS6_9RHOB|nr:molybdopterin-dependent oxidoreductase [Pseudogemmobacter faecipullorum]